MGLAARHTLIHVHELIGAQQHLGILFPARQANAFAAGLAQKRHGQVDLALVFAVSVVATISAAALIGVSIPLLLERLGFDPAIASSVFVTPTIDAIGFLTFLGIATSLLL